MRSYNTESTFATGSEQRRTIVHIGSIKVNDRPALSTPVINERPYVDERKNPVDLTGLVENTGVEPVTSCMPCKRSSQLS
jgi:hypothetical protein